MGEKSMLKPFWIAEQKGSTAILPLSKPTDSVAGEACATLPQEGITRKTPKST